MIGITLGLVAIIGSLGVPTDCADGVTLACADVTVAFARRGKMGLFVAS